MTRLEKARVELVAALKEERELITAELARLGVRVVRVDSPPPVRRPKPAAAPASVPVRIPPHRQFEGGGKKAKTGTETCPECGRTELFKAPGPGQRGRLAFHYAKPPCELVCKGGKVADASAEDLKAGVHEKGKCPKCDSARVAYK